MKLIFCICALLCFTFPCLPLIYAGDTKSLPEILREYHTSDEKKQGWSELAYATEKGYLETAEKMLRNGLDPNQLTADESKTPLSIAIQCGYPRLVQQMIDYKANTNLSIKNVYDSCMPQMKTAQYPERLCGPDTYSPLMVSIQYRSPEIAAILIENGADPFYRSFLQYQPIHLAIRHQQLETLEKLLSKGVDVNSQDMWGYTPLHYCAFLPESPIVAQLGQRLLERGANPNEKIHRTGHQFTVLHLTAMNGHSDFLQLLIQRGADVNIKDAQEATPLWRAANSSIDSRDIIRGLLRAGAQVNEINNGLAAQDPHSHLGASILAVALLNHKIDTAELLIQNGADVEIVDTYGKTPLMYAVANNDPDATALLLRYRANPNNPGRIGRTSMEIAHNLEYKDIFELLIHAHAGQMYK